MFPTDTKVLIVDDSNFARNILKNSLKELGFWKILEADAAKQAQSLLSEEEQVKDPVHLIVTDVHMPEMSGLELLKWIRSHATWKDMPVIILTTSQEKTEILEAGKLGVSHFIIKPFDTATLADRMASTWNKHGEAFVKALGTGKKAD
jgi:two-component system chemotaxis response regulator CheY